MSFILYSLFETYKTILFGEDIIILLIFKISMKMLQKDITYISVVATWRLAILTHGELRRGDLSAAKRQHEAIPKVSPFPFTELKQCDFSVQTCIQVTSFDI